MKQIPVSAGEDIAQRFDCEQVVIIARKTGDGPDAGEMVTTYGVDVDHCAVAAHIGEFLRTKVMGWPCPTHEKITSEIARERERQMSVERWTNDHDDLHDKGEMAKAAACYAWAAALPEVTRDAFTLGSWRESPVMLRLWPWNRSWWKPKDSRRDLVRAAALIVAEIERLDRASERSGQ